jgi:molecular chaperone GrpE
VGLIHPCPGELFEPGKHEAVVQMAQPGVESGHIVQTFQAGYTLGEGRVLRPAKVAVAP